MHPQLVRGTVIQAITNCEPGERFGSIRTFRGSQIWYEPVAWCSVAARNLIVPEFVHTTRTLTRLPEIGEQVYGIVGKNAGLSQWATATQYEGALFKILANDRIAQKDIDTALGIIYEAIDLYDVISEDEVHEAMLKLEELSLGLYQFGAIIEHYLMGHPAEKINQRVLP